MCHNNKHSLSTNDWNNTMKCFGKFLALAALVLASFGSARAATVTFDLKIDENGPGSFNLYASTGLDNFGIAAYGAPLTGGILSLDHLSPLGLALNTFQPVGFSLFRSADGSPGVQASQDTVTPTQHLVRGFGQVGGNLATAPGVVAFLPQEQAIYNAPLLVASGTWAGIMPGFNLSSPDLGSNVFSAASGIAVTRAEIVTNTTVVPEPGALLLAAAGGLALVTVGRRKMVARRR